MSRLLNLEERGFDVEIINMSTGTVSPWRGSVPLDEGRKRTRIQGPRKEGRGQRGGAPYMERNGPPNRAVPLELLIRAYFSPFFSSPGSVDLLPWPSFDDELSQLMPLDAGQPLHAW